MQNFFRKSWPDVLVVAGFLVLSLLYFFTPLSQGLVLGGHDTVAGMGQGHEQELFNQATGETTRWTNSIFSGMPTYQISPSYGPTHLLGRIGWVLGLFTTGPLRYVFFYLFGFYLLMRSLSLRPAVSALGSVLWAFSSYFFIIIAAGHIWKVNTLGYIPPTIAGLVLAYRGKYLWGCLVTALFTALQVLSNHIQMSYYFAFLMFFICGAYGVDALLKRRLGQWGKATAAIVLGGLLGVAANLPNLYHTYEYSKHSMRGPSELTAAVSETASAQRPTDGLDRDYITAWSYGIDETMTLLIPMYKGGGSTNIFDREDVEELDGFDELNQHCGALYQAMGGQGGYLPGTSQYWGDQPMTVGPVYVGAIVCFLFVLGLFVVRGPLKWALLLATVLSLLFSWGRNIMPLTDFFIDYLPMYSKFRTVSSALVVAEFTMPLLGVLALAEVLRRPQVLLGSLRGRIGLGVSLLATAGSCLLFALVPSLADCISGQDMQMLEQLAAMGVPADFTESYRAAIIHIHEAILSASAWRSFFLIAVAAIVIVAYVLKSRANQGGSRTMSLAVVAALLAVSLVDMWDVNSRYLNADNFQSEGKRLEGFRPTPADEVVLADKTLDYRVLNLAAGNPFNESTNQTAYWHKSVGGYHAAKLHRYQDLIDRYLNAEVQRLSAAVDNAFKMVPDSTAFMALVQERMATAGEDADPAAVQCQIVREIVAGNLHADSIAPVLCMLNTRWIIAGSMPQAAFLNESASGNAWFVEKLQYVDGADAEIAALGALDLKRAAVADRRFEDVLGDAGGAGTVKLLKYQPNELRYAVESTKGGVVALSEIYYPGWTATVDGKEVPVGRVNYVLRALRVEPGRHEVVLEFRPTTLKVTSAVAYASILVILAGFGFGIFAALRRKGEGQR